MGFVLVLEAAELGIEYLAQGLAAEKEVGLWQMGSAALEEVVGQVERVVVEEVPEPEAEG